MSLDIAYFSPLPPQKTGIADYSADLLPHLGRLAKVTVFVDDERCLSTRLPGELAIHPMGEFPSRRWQFDIVIYHMGNSQFHETIYAYLKRFPGLTVLHDHGLHHLIASITAWRGNFTGYAREMGYAAGETGLRLVRAIQSGQRGYPLFEYPLNDRVLDLSLGVAVHSHYAARLIRSQHPQLEVVVIPQLVVLPDIVLDARRRLGVPPEAFVIGCVGQVTIEKHIDLVLRAFARAKSRVPGACLLLVGDVPDWYPLDLDALIRQLELEESVVRTGYVDDHETLRTYVAAIDVCVNIRFPTVGETSNSLLRVMAMGRPAIVSNVGWYAELPDDCCVKMMHGPDDEAVLAQHLIELAGDRARREDMGHQARAYIARECAPERVARAYMDFAQQIVTRAWHQDDWESTMKRGSANA